MMGYGFDMFGLGSIWMILFWVVIIGLIVWGVTRIVRANSKSSTNIPPSSGQPSALDILKQRYARGEISKDQFEEMRRDLSA
jgi:putative membrane protein